MYHLMQAGTWMVVITASLQYYFLQIYIRIVCITKINLVDLFIYYLTVFHLKDELGSKITDQRIMNCIQQVMSLFLNLLFQYS